jgi:outer membrane protein OmpA-like peptidoglycan-associated protein
VLAGVTIPVTKPVLPPRPPPAPPVVPGALSAAEAAPVSFAFAPGSAVLSASEQNAIRVLAFRRGSRGIEIIGFGEADGEDAQSQYAGVKLGLERARAIAAALEGWTVPMAALHIGADAPGRGAAARRVV